MNQFSSRKPVVALSRSSRSKLFTRSVLSVAVGLMVSTTALAQKSEGTIYGTTKAGTTVTITSLDTGSTRKIQADASGNFVLPLLSPGDYQLESGGVKKKVSVAIGSGTQVNLNEQDSLESVSVVAKRQRPTIDVASQESNSVFTAEQIQQLPVSSSVNAVAQLAPGVVKGGTGYGDMPSFGGSSVAENGYYINGFDVTNIRNFLAYAEVPFGGVGQEQVKNGGYGVEYGRSMGGVISLSTKTGTSEWHGGVSMVYIPSSTETAPDVMSKEPMQAGTYWLFNSPQRSRTFVTDFYLGGPLVEDKLFGFALFQKPDRLYDLYGQSSSYSMTSNKPNGLLKLDFLPLEGHKLEYTYINNQKQNDYQDYNNSRRYSTTHDVPLGASTTTSGGTVNILKYTGYLTDELAVSALAGRVEYQNPSTTGYRNSGKDCPYVLNVDLSKLGCWATPGDYGYARDIAATPFDTDNRDAYRFDLDYNIGSHRIKAGLDNQTFASSQAGGAYYSGGVYYRYYVQGAGINTLNTVPLAAGTPYVRERIYTTTSGSYKVINTAQYIEDSWNVTPKLMVYGGLRFESFDNQNAAGESFVKANDLFAPRGGFSFDANGDSTLKIFGNYGRYFIPVASNTNVRMTQGTLYSQKFYTYTGRDARTFAPLGLSQLGPTNNLGGDGSLPNSGSIADQSLTPMSQDELIIGFQQAIAKGWIGGIKYTKRIVNDGMDDYCDHTQIADYVKANVYAGFDEKKVPECVLINPGRPITIALDLRSDGKLRNVTIPAAATGLANYKREYDALEFSIAKEFDGRWSGNASYTYSTSVGSAEGYVNSTIQQVDAGVSQDFDYGRFTDGAFGPLPNQHRHAFKIYGSVNLTDNLSLGLNFSAISGRPISRIGFVPCVTLDTAFGCSYQSASSYYYLNSAGRTVLGQRGDQGETDWVRQLDVQIAYRDKVGKSEQYTLQLDVFNLLNAQSVTDVNQINDFSRATTLVGSVGQLSQNYGLPLAYQAPRWVRITARYEF